MNTLDMPTSYLPALELQDAVGKDVPMDTLPVDLMALIDNCTTEWATDDGEDPFAALGGESYEQLLEEGVTLLDGGCGLIEDVLDFVTEEVAAAPCAEAEEKPDAQPAEAPDEEPATPYKYFTADPDPGLAMSPFSLNSMWNADKLGFYPSPDIWNKFDFPADVEEPVEDLRSGLDITDYPKKKIETWIDWDTDVDYSEPAGDKLPKRSAVKESPMWGTAWEYSPMLTPAQLRRKLMEDDSRPRLDDLAVTPDNALPLANRSTTVPAASALKTRPMRSLLNTKQQQQQHVYKSTSSRSLLLSNARSKVQTAAPSHSVVKLKAASSVTATCEPVPPAVSSVEIKAGSEEETVSASSRPETPQSQSESEDEAPVFRHNTIDTIFTSTLCDSSSTVYLTPSDSSGSPKSTICDEDDDEDDDEEEEGEDYEHENLRSPPESVIREERPARTVLPYISDHSYHLSKSNVRIDGLGVQTPSDSEEEIDVVSVGGDKGTARLPNNPSARDRRQIQIKVATAIHRQSRHQTTTTVAAEAPSGSRKRQASATPTRSCVKRTRVPPVPLVLGRGKGKGKAFGRGRRRANADEEPDPCEKRSMHNSMERQRRIDLRNLVDRLRATVPATEDNKRAAKVTILQEAAKYCLALAARAQAYEVEKARLWSKQGDLHVRLSALRREAAEQRRKIKELEKSAAAPCYDDEYFTAEEIKPEPVEVDCEDEEYQY